MRLPGVLGVSGHWLLTGEGPMRGGEDGLRLQVIRQIVDGTIDDDTAHQLAMGAEDDGTGELERRYRDLAEHSLGLICTHDLDGVLEWVNPAIATLLGHEPSLMIGRSLADFLAAPEAVGPYLEIIRENRADKGWIEVLTRGGESRFLQFHNVIVEPPDRRPYVLGHAQDVTALLRAEGEVGR